jgi:hypothetical protein
MIKIEFIDIHREYTYKYEDNGTSDAPNNGIGGKASNRSATVHWCSKVCYENRRVGHVTET